ncbi:MAG: PilT/PilU family type 4a pilus ATPase [Deltaproteobacteria bacterium]|nr:PilT/PilU family type 4a pilus ATPase [Deltaproteobacteria bacterium]
MDKDRLTKLLTAGIQRGVSDVHIAVGHRPHYRVKGDLVSAKSSVMTPADTLQVARVLLEDPDLLPGDLQRERDFSYSIPGVGRFRAHIFCQRGSVGAVIRAIPYDVRGFDALNLPAVVGDIASARRGLILVSGATGMGKSATIAAMLKYINETRQAHVVTIEDPIEYLFGHGKSLITQREVGSDTLGYREALVAALREDPDVIMVGELMHPETAEICLKAAETGHLVISAMHTADVVRTVDRLIGMFPDSAQQSVRVRLADCINAVVSQRLLVNKSGLALLPAVEILRATRAVRDVLRRGAPLAELKAAMEGGKDLYGMQTFDQHLVELCKSGAIKREVGRTAASDRAYYDEHTGAEDSPN